MVKSYAAAKFLPRGNPPLRPISSEKKLSERQKVRAKYVTGKGSYISLRVRTKKFSSEKSLLECNFFLISLDILSQTKENPHSLDKVAPLISG